MEIEDSGPTSTPVANRPTLGRTTSRNYHRRRFVVGACLAIGLIGFIALCNQRGEYYALIAPGELSNPHAQLWQGSNHAKSCKNCHPGIESASESDASLGVSSSIHANMSQQEACAVCHAQQLPHVLRGTPHDLPHEDLTRLASLQKKPNTTTHLVSLDKPIVDVHLDWQHRSFQCNDCHREHQGRDALLAAMDNGSCQACHQKRFDSFENQHSEFTSYPPPSPTPAFSFNHRTHAAKHFPKQQSEFNCNACHLKQEAGVTKLVRTTSFETACAQCHRDPLSTTLADGVIVWQLPNVNTEEFKAAGDAPLAWPEIASAVTDLELSPLMRQLIIAELEQSGEPLAETTIVRIAAAENLSDLALESEQANETIRLAATASQRVLQDVVANGQESIKKRLKRLHANPAANQYEGRIIDELAKGIPPDLFDEAYRNWFGSVLVDDRNSGSTNSKIPASPFLPELEAPRVIPPSDDDLLDGRITSNLGDSPANGDLLGHDLAASDLANIPKGDLIGVTVADTQTPREYDARKNLKAGGWMIDRVRNAIVYIPNGHGDRWMQAYAEWLSQSPTGSIKGSQNDVISRCLECHTSPKGLRIADAQAPLAEAWHSRLINPNEKKLTRFDHRPHLTLPQLRDCTSCHAMTELPGDSTQLVSVDNSKIGVDGAPVSSPAPSSHDFHFLSKKMCVSCHNAETQVQNCTLCHDYHVAPK